MNKSLSTLVLLTFLGMVGIYIGAYLAWRKYQAYDAQLSSPGGVTNLLTSLLKS
ncbi:MAG TPA: hypothetical protein VHH88_08530 [Verrucomicrobiae bacterium]|nr:hypothetical protein [Verrucomicrobiae bacterium]